MQLGLTPLHIAVTDSQLDVVSCLLELGASPFTTTKTGENKGGNKRFSRPGGSKQSSVAITARHSVLRWESNRVFIARDRRHGGSPGVGEEQYGGDAGAAGRRWARGRHQQNPVDAAAPRRAHGPPAGACASLPHLELSLRE